MFKQFDVDYNQITIDGDIIKKPRYLSIKQWLDFWDRLDVDQEEIDRQLEASFQDGMEEQEEEHEQEIEYIKNSISSHLDSILMSFESLLQDKTYTLDEKLSMVSKKIDKVREKVCL